VTYLETAPGSDELRVVHLDQHATAEQIRRAAAAREMNHRCAEATVASAEPKCSMSRAPRREDHTICTAVAPEAVFTVRT
jgi:hypothetical protein